MPIHYKWPGCFRCVIQTPVENPASYFMLLNRRIKYLFNNRNNNTPFIYILVSFLERKNYVKGKLHTFYLGQYPRKLGPHSFYKL